MKRTEKKLTETAKAHIRFAVELHDAYSSIGASVRPMTLKPGLKSRRETLLKQIQQLQNKLDTQWYSDCPGHALSFNSIYLNAKWAKEAEAAI